MTLVISGELTGNKPSCVELKFTVETSLPAGVGVKFALVDIKSVLRGKFPPFAFSSKPVFISITLVRFCWNVDISGDDIGITDEYTLEGVGDIAGDPKSENDEFSATPGNSVVADASKVDINCVLEEIAPLGVVTDGVIKRR